MLFFKSKVGQFQIVVVIFSLVLMAGCISVLPETPESEVPAAAEAAGETAPLIETGGSEAAVVDETQSEIPDRQALAEYQLRLSDTDFGGVEASESVAIDQMPNEIPDRQGLAEYQLRLSDTDFGGVEAKKSVVIDQMPGQIPDRQAVAEYQFQLSGGSQAP